MKQTTLFDNCVKRLEKKEMPISSNINFQEAQLKKVYYKASSIDKDSIPGFNTFFKDWIYPINFPIREYQLHIVQECLFKNTMVCLPTGLGKTFIASVVMYNFYRWYPSGKIIFLAPTRPLVNQQMFACQETVPIDPSDVLEMTGSIPQNLRINLWKEKRVFFMTAQVLVNDLISKICPGKDIIILVLDEAHKASKNHAYCQVVRELTGEKHKNRLFRIVGLSATPGDDISSIQDVIQNLLISHIELRTDECPDIKQYSHSRLVEEVIVPLGDDVIDVRDRLLKICDPIIDYLKRASAINDSFTTNKLTKYGLLKMKDEYRSNNAGYHSYSVQSNFSQAISLYYGIELVQQHGLHPTFLYFENAINNSNSMPQISALMNNHEFMEFYDHLRDKLMTNSQMMGHPKLFKLKDIVMQHFSSKTPEEQKTTRVIVFSQIRDSVEEIIKILSTLQPLIRPIAFMGKTKQVSQRKQMQAMSLFADGTYNVLVSTCIGEEGLDIGDVDLIICFDSQKSPIRLIQRVGRTGRKRKGRIVMLLSEGKEVKNYRTSLTKKSRIHSAIFEGYKHLVFYPDNPRMVPLGLEPTVSYQKVNITKLSRQNQERKSNKQLKSKPIEEFLLINTEDQTPVFNSDPYVPDALRFRGEKAKTVPPLTSSQLAPQKLTFTDRFGSNRYKKSLYRTMPTFKIGHSDLTRNFLSILRLKEMHLRGTTNIRFHLSSSRLIDIDESLSSLEDEEEQESQVEDIENTSHLSFPLSSDDDFDCTEIDESRYPFHYMKCLKKINNSSFAIISRCRGPIKPALLKIEFQNLMKNVEFIKLDNPITVIDYEIEKVLNQSKQRDELFASSIQNQLSKTSDSFPVINVKQNSIDLLSRIDCSTKNQFQTIKQTVLCTSTPISSNNNRGKNRALSLKNLLQSFKIPQKSVLKKSLNDDEIPLKNRTLLKSFNIGTKSTIDIFQNSAAYDSKSILSCDISSDLFDPVSESIMNECCNQMIQLPSKSVTTTPMADGTRSCQSSLLSSFKLSNTKNNVQENRKKDDLDLNYKLLIKSSSEGEEKRENNENEMNKSNEDLFSDDFDPFSPLSSNKSLSLDSDVESDKKQPIFGDIITNQDPSIMVDDGSDVSESFLITKSIIDNRKKSTTINNIKMDTDSDISDSFLNSKSVIDNKNQPEMIDNDNSDDGSDISESFLITKSVGENKNSSTNRSSNDGFMQSIIGFEKTTLKPNCVKNDGTASSIRSSGKSILSKNQFADDNIRESIIDPDKEADVLDYFSVPKDDACKSRSRSPSFGSSLEEIVAEVETKKKVILTASPNKTTQNRNILLTDSALTSQKIDFPRNRFDIDESFNFDSDFEDIFQSRIPSEYKAAAKTSSVKLKKNINTNNVKQFFISQAEMAGNKHDHQDDDENDENDYFDGLTDSFIDDRDENCEPAITNTQMQQIYLKSIKSPKCNVPQSGFATVDTETGGSQKFVYSQNVLSSDDDYLMDSFVVPDDYETPKKKRRTRKSNSKRSPAMKVKKYRRLADLNDSCN